MDMETEIIDAKERIAKLEACTTAMAATLSKIEGSVGTTEMLVKWVILPLIVILGGLVGIKIALPGV